MEIKEIVAVVFGQSAVTAFQKKHKKHSCKWAHCPKGTEPNQGPHEAPIEYDKDKKANLSRSSDQALSDVVDEKERAQFEKEGFLFEAHHLVPVIAFEEEDGAFPDLTNNARLAGYNVNNPNNLMALHANKKNVRHLDLQYHAGNHGLRTTSIKASKPAVTKEILTAAEANAKDPAYYGKSTSYKEYVTRRLTYTEKLSLVQCWQDKKGTGKPQSKWLNKRLRLDSDAIRRRIKNWTILVVKDGQKNRHLSKRPATK